MNKKELEERLEQALRILEEQSKRIEELQTELLQYKQQVTRKIPISEVSPEQELSSDTLSRIDKAVDLILKYAEKIPYLQ